MNPYRTRLLPLLAGFAVVYLVWGSTYLAMKFAVATLPPFLMAGTRFTVAGILLYLWGAGQGLPRPDGRAWLASAVNGALLLLGGNGLLAWGLREVPSGVAAVIVGTTPLWMLGLDWLLYRGPRPTGRIVAGMAAGFAGAALLVDPTGLSVGGRPWLSLLAILLAPVAWSLGSLHSRHGPAAGPPLRASALQMLTGGVLMLLVGSLLGEWPRLAEREVSARSVGGLVYLIVAGSLLAFTTYTWLLRAASPTAVSTYAFVNPLVAVLLGWLFAGETPNERVLVAGGLIVGATALITLGRPRPALPPPAVTAEPLAEQPPGGVRVAAARCGN